MLRLPSFCLPDVKTTEVEKLSIKSLKWESFSKSAKIALEQLILLFISMLSVVTPSSFKNCNAQAQLETPCIPTCIQGFDKSWPQRRTVQGFLKKLKQEILYDSTIPLLGIYSEKTLIQKDKYTPTFTEALFTYMAEFFRCSPATVTTLLVGYTLIQNKQTKVFVFFLR